MLFQVINMEWVVLQMHLNNDFYTFRLNYKLYFYDMIQIGKLSR